MNKPNCYGTFRSPQNDAENDCHQCQYDNDCFQRWKERKTLQFFLPMEPPTATQQMHQVRMVRGKPQFYEPMEVKQARAKLLTALCRHKPDEPVTVGVRLTVKWCFPAGKNHRNGEWRVTKPDTDNLQKLLKDVMTGCGFWADDALVCSEIVEKFWADTPGIFIRVEAVA